MRLDKFLAHNGYGSRNAVKKLLKEKVVTVNDHVMTKGTYKLDLDHDVVKVLMDEIEYEENVYYMMNKPAGYICSHHSNLYPSVLELIDTHRDDLIMVGRLDVDTEGLLFITNDGQFSHRVAHGNKEVYKKYYVKLRDTFDESYVSELESGIMLDDEMLKPASIELIDDHSLYLSIAEGKYHQVKRMMIYANNEVIHLQRVQIGHVTLDESLQLGQYRSLSDDEIKQF